MKKLLPCFYALLMFTSTGFAQRKGLRTVAVRGDDRPGNGSAGLFIGINEFEDETLRDLNYAVYDAIMQADMFVNELQLIPAAHCTLVLSGEPEAREVVRVLERLKRKGVQVRSAERVKIFDALARASHRARNDRDLLVVGISSHGFDSGDSVFVAASDSRGYLLEQTCVPFTQVRRFLHDSRAGKKLMFLDACRNNPRTDDRSVGKEATASFLRALDAFKGEAVLTSCARDEISFESPELKHGVFTHFLLQGLAGGAEADGEGVITLGSLSQYVSKETRRWARLKHGVTQTPHFKDADIGSADMPLALRLTPELEEDLGRALGEDRTPLTWEDVPMGPKRWNMTHPEWTHMQWNSPGLKNFIRIQFPGLPDFEITDPAWVAYAKEAQLPMRLNFGIPHIQFSTLITAEADGIIRECFEQEVDFVRYNVSLKEFRFFNTVRKAYNPLPDRKVREELNWMFHHGDLTSWQEVVACLTLAMRFDDRGWVDEDFSGKYNTFKLIWQAKGRALFKGDVAGAKAQLQDLLESLSHSEDGWRTQVAHCLLQIGENTAETRRLFLKSQVSGIEWMRWYGDREALNTWRERVEAGRVDPARYAGALFDLWPEAEAFTLLGKIEPDAEELRLASTLISLFAYLELETSLNEAIHEYTAMLKSHPKPTLGTLRSSAERNQAPPLSNAQWDQLLSSVDLAKVQNWYKVDFVRLYAFQAGEPEKALEILKAMDSDDVNVKDWFTLWAAAGDVKSIRNRLQAMERNFLDPEKSASDLSSFAYGHAILENSWSKGMLAADRIVNRLDTADQILDAAPSYYKHYALDPKGLGDSLLRAEKHLRDDYDIYKTAGAYDQYSTVEALEDSLKRMEPNCRSVDQVVYLAKAWVEYHPAGVQQGDRLIRKAEKMAVESGTWKSSITYFIKEGLNDPVRAERVDRRRKERMILTEMEKGFKRQHDLMRRDALRQGIRLPAYKP